VRHVRSPVGVAVLGGALVTFASCVPPQGAGDITQTAPAGSVGHPSVDAARELDQQGVRSFRAGRYTDAIAYFRAAFQRGGPSSELWNIVRCREGMDDAEGAAAGIDEYLAAKDLLPQDRAQATREAQALRSRPAVLTVMTSPPGASVSVDGKPEPGTTPLSTDLRAGSHTVAVQRGGYLPATQSVEARFGRAVIVTLDLARAAE
jgi:PEGA domain